jgi:hypothetical protein
MKQGQERLRERFFEPSLAVGTRRPLVGNLIPSVGARHHNHRTAPYPIHPHRCLGLCLCLSQPLFCSTLPNRGAVFPLPNPPIPSSPFAT